MKLLLFFFDMASFLFFRGLAAGGLASIIWFFAVESDRVQRDGLISLHSYTEKLVGYNVQEKVDADRSKPTYPFKYKESH